MKNTPALANALGHTQTDKRIEILRLIGKTGSISKAAREAAVSYKAAWQAIDTLSNLAGVDLVEKVVGGSGGGGAKLTEAGEQLLSAANLFEQVRHEVIDHWLTGKPNIRGSLLSQLALRTSMRNHLPCQISALENLGQVIRVFLQLPENSGQLVARITRASAELLALEVGQSVLALFKAASVTIRPTSEKESHESINCLSGIADRVSTGSKEYEIAITIPSGQHLVGFAATDLSIQPKSKVIALVDEAAIVVAQVN